ncbi:MAG: hypothetical protein KR126chlam3_00703 [Chlamydiae bacterium]|nr:hypothetical protein [Chlamydiota bacterium]
MDSAMMLAKVFGPLLGIVGLWMLLYGDNVVKITTSIKNSPAAQYFSAFVNILIGLFIINTYNVWEWNVFFFITLLGWAMFIRGILGLYMPQLIVQWFMTKNAWMKTMGIIPFVWGLILTWTGYYM